MAWLLEPMNYLTKMYLIFTLVLIPKEYLGAASLTSLSAPSGLYAPGAGVTNCLGSLGLMWSEGATGSSLPKNLDKWIHQFCILENSGGFFLDKKCKIHALQ